MQYPEPDDGAWPARVLRNRRMNQVPETENPATRLQFMHQRPETQLYLPILWARKRTAAWCIEPSWNLPGRAQ